MSTFVILFAAAVFSFAIRSSRVLKLLVLAALLAAGYAATAALPMGLSHFESDHAITLFEIVLLVVMAAVVLSEEENINITQTLFLGAASVALLESQSFLTFVLSFEALSIISFVLVANIKNREAAIGAVKMFVSGALATALIVLGSAFYLFEGHDLNAPLQEVGIYGTAGLWIMLVGIFYKLTIVPMHTWAADSYAQIRPAHAAILSGMVKSVAVVGVFMTFMPFLLQQNSLNLPILVTLALVTMTLGNFMALFQKQVGKILSYSSIAHAGYMLLAFVAVKSAYAPVAIFYIAIAYIFMQTALFMLLDKVGKGSSGVTLDDLKGLGTKDKTMALLFTVQLFSLAGIPLLAGFLSKAVLVYAVVDVGLPLVALVTLLNSALSVAYYAWIVKHIYFDEPARHSALGSLRVSGFVAQAILLSGTLYFGLFAATVFDLFV